MNRYNLVKVPHIFDYANCSHAIKADLNAMYKMHLIKLELLDHAGDSFDLFKEIIDVVFPGKTQSIITHMNDNNNVHLTNHYSTITWNAMITYLSGKYTVNANFADRVKEIRNTDW